MVSVHDALDVDMRNCYFGKNLSGDDTLHYAYSRGNIVECTFENARADAFDVDISEVRVTGSRFFNIGNDCLDLMTTKAFVSDCGFYSSGDKGISTGEDSRLIVENNLFQGCKTGIEIKDRSEVDYRINYIRGSDTAINLYKKNWRYEGGGVLKAGTIYLSDCRKTITKDRYSYAEYEEIREEEPKSGYARKFEQGIEAGIQ